MKYSLTYYNEIGRGAHDSRRLHLPTPTSGITIGPGYDLKHRTEKEVILDLTKGGDIELSTAKAISKGVGLTGSEALEFINKNKDISISSEQEYELFIFMCPVYELRAEMDYDKFTHIKNPPPYKVLPQLVKELLVDYSYNVGVSKFPTFFNALISGDKEIALKEYVRYSNGVPLGRRNKDTLDLLNHYKFVDLRG